MSLPVTANEKKNKYREETSLVKILKFDDFHGLKGLHIRAGFLIPSLI